MSNELPEYFSCRNQSYPEDLSFRHFDDHSSSSSITLIECDAPSETNSGHWFIQEPNQTWSERWALTTYEKKCKYALELNPCGHGMDIMPFTCGSALPEAPMHWKTNSLIKKSYDAITTNEDTQSDSIIAIKSPFSKLITFFVKVGLIIRRTLPRLISHALTYFTKTIEGLFIKYSVEPLNSSVLPRYQNEVEEESEPTRPKHPGHRITQEAGQT